MRYRLIQPGVVAAASNLQDPAHHFNVVLIPIFLDKLVQAADLPGAQFRRHWSSSVLVMLLASRVHRILGVQFPGRTNNAGRRRTAKEGSDDWDKSLCYPIAKPRVAESHRS